MKSIFSKHLIVVILIIISAFYSTVSAATLVRMLAIGNSFSEDALEAYVGDLAKADGVQVIIGNLYWGGCDLATHWNNASTNNPGYSYRKIVVDANGVITKTTRESTSIEDAVQDENWDYIAFQQVSQHSGKLSTFFPYITNLKQYVSNLKTNPSVKYMLHRTWAYTTNSTHSEYEYYHNNQLEMYDSIINVYDEVSARTGIDIIIPTGTAIQNERSSYIGDNLNRDGYHLTYGLGRYTAACAWYEKIVGRPVVGNTFKPSDVSTYDANIAQNAAHFAVTNPSSITTMVSYVAPAPAILTNDVNIDFGDKATNLSSWNSITSCTLNSSIASFKDAAGNATAISITVNDAFNAINQYGATTTNTTLSLPAAASIDFFYGNGTGLWNGIAEPTGGLLIAGLFPNQQYNFYMFGSRSGVTDNREAYYTVSGDRDETVYLDASNNTTNIASVHKIRAKGNGTINITIGAGPNNNQANKLFYINTLVIKPTVDTSVQNITATNFRLYPNPVKSIANLEADENLNNVVVYDLMGKKILELNNIMSKKATLDFSSVKDGCYMMKQNNECIRVIKNSRL